MKNMLIPAITVLSLVATAASATERPANVPAGWKLPEVTSNSPDKLAGVLVIDGRLCKSHVRFGELYAVTCGPDLFFDVGPDGRLVQRPGGMPKAVGGN